MIIHVLQEDIDKAKKLIIKKIRSGVAPGVCSICPVALALKRLGYTNALVSHTRAYFNNDNYIQLPSKATEFIAAFDNNKPVGPFSFELEIKPLTS